MTQHLWSLSATEVALRIASREVTARQVTQSVLGRIAETNPTFNALAVVSEASALKAADAADAAQARGDALGPLHGVPVTIKVNVDVAGEATTDAVEAFKDNVAQTDSPLVKSMRDAGAVIVGRSNAPAFSLRWFTDNAFHGRTLNPFDPSVTPGGSSGGGGRLILVPSLVGVRALLLVERIRGRRAGGPCHLRHGVRRTRLQVRGHVRHLRHGGCPDPRGTGEGVAGIDGLPGAHRHLRPREVIRGVSRSTTPTSRNCTF